MPDSHQRNPQILFDAFYCLDERRDNDDSILHSTCSAKCQGENNLEFFEQVSWEDDELRSLLHKEQENEPHDGFVENLSLAKTRGETVEWMLKVTGYFSFSAVTAVLAVNYLDRFVYSYKSHVERKPWVTQLAAVACLSLAAKVEETQAPLLLDLQVEEPVYVFESKTIQRMEILILSTLQWRMYPVTPLSFLEYIVTRLKFKTHLRREFLRRCECLVLFVISDCRFLSCCPSAFATAVMVYVVRSLEPGIAVEYQDQLLAILGIDKEKVEDCCGVIQEMATSVDFYSNTNKRKFGLSPKCVADVSFSSDTSNDSWGLSPISSVTSSPQHLSKKIKSHEEEESDFLI